jgi:hypothetical protein
MERMIADLHSVFCSVIQTETNSPKKGFCDPVEFQIAIRQFARGNKKPMERYFERGGKTPMPGRTL